MSKHVQNQIREKVSLTPKSYFLIGQGQALVAVEALQASRYAQLRFPLKQEDSPRHADYLVVAGPVNRRYRPVVARLAAQIARPGRVAHLESPSILPGADMAGYAKPPESKGGFTTFRQNSPGFSSITEPAEIIKTLHNEFTASPTYLRGDDTGPGTLVPLRSFEEKELATEDLTLSLGPAHPAVYGPLRLVLILDGEQIAAAEADPGYAHRGLEKLAVGHAPSSAPAFGAALDALAPLSGTLAVTLALEKMAGSGQVPIRAGYLRLAALELERIGSHLFAQATLLKTLALDGPAHKAFDLYAEVLAGLRLLCGEPTWQFIVPGGVRSDLNANALSDLTGLVRQLQAWVRQELGPPAHFLSLVTKISRYSLGSRLKGLGVLGHGEAVELGFTGPNLRASGSSFDCRAFISLASTGLPYGELGFKPTFSSRSSRGDAYSRYQLRIQEIAASSVLVDQALKNLPAGPYQLDLDLDEAFLLSNFDGGPPGLAEAGGTVESPRGLMEARLALTLNPAGKMVIERLHFRSPSWRHFQALPGLVTGTRLPDALVIINSLDIAPDEAER